MPKIGDHAVVLGASMGGLLAARVLADAYRQVTIVERDPLPESGLDRKGVPQGRHAHGLLPRGAQVLDELFPGLLAELVAGVATRPTTSHRSRTETLPSARTRSRTCASRYGRLCANDGSPGSPSWQSRWPPR